MSIDERLNLERQCYDQESTQSRYASRLKSTCCRQCGSEDGMQGICREALAMMHYSIQYVRWHKEEDNDEYLFVACGTCNPGGIIPDGFTEMARQEVLDWLDLDCDPMQPNYDALAAEPEPVLASQNSRDSAGLEG